MIKAKHKKFRFLKLNLLFEIAIKLKQKKIATKITGLAITGSFKAFDVISEL